MFARPLYGATFTVGMAVFAAAIALGIVQAWQSGGRLPELPYDELGQARDASALGDVAAAVRQLRTYAALQPAKADGWMRLAQFLQSTGDAPGAIAAYEHAVASIPAPAEAYGQLAMLYYKAGRRDVARERAVVAERNGLTLPPAVRQALGL